MTFAGYAAPAAVLPTPHVLSIMSPWCAWGIYRAGAVSAALASQTAPAANLAIYVPFVVTSPATFTRGFWYNGSAPDGTNNVSVGIYTPDGTRRATTGNVAKSGASVIQGAAFAASYDATPGHYYMAIEHSVGSDLNGAMGYTTTPLHKIAGLYVEAVGSNPLPANATFATWANNIMPFFGIAQTSFAV